MTSTRERHRQRHWRDRDTSDKQCPTCGRTGDDVQVHHNDGNPQNGHPANLRGRCPTCHLEGEHNRPDDVDRDCQPTPSGTKPPRPSIRGPFSR